MRLFWLMCVSLCGGVAAAQEPMALHPIVAELRLGNQALERIVWRGADESVLLDRETADALGLLWPAGAAMRASLADIPGLRYQWIEAETALALTCASQCYARQQLSSQRATIEVQQSDPGAFLNFDLSATVQQRRTIAGGLFELGVFGAHGAGAASWVIDSAREGALRLETTWTRDDPQRRRNLRFGDSFTRGGATGAPFRFGGIQLATDFALDPGFVPYPIATVRGEAAAPSVVDLYVDGALRLRQRVDAGPFEIADPPLLVGAGVAELIVTDPLGREHVFAQPFAVNALMLRPGLTEYSLALGAEREEFARESFAYGRTFVSALYRRGLTSWLTGEARAEANADLTNVGVGVSTAAPWLGQADLAIAASEGADTGLMARLSAQRAVGALRLFTEAEASSEAFQRLGEGESTPLRTQIVAGVSVDGRRAGSISLTAVSRDLRGSDDVRTLALSYAPPATRWGRFDLNALYAEDDDAFVSVGVRFTAILAGGVAAGAFVQNQARGATLGLSAQRAPDPEGGFGWRARASRGETERLDAALAHQGAAHEASLAYSRAPAGDGVRAQYAGGVAWIDGALYAARPIRESFALVDVGYPGTRVYRDRRPVALTDRRGRALVTGLRPYQQNPIGVDIDDLPLEAQVADDEIVAVPAARRGIVVRFARDVGRAHEARVVDAHGADLPEGAMLVRLNDGGQFPVAARGRVYLSGVRGTMRFSSAGCVLDVSADDLVDGAVLQCRAV